MPQICSKYQNTDCWNGSATVPVNNFEFDSKTISGQRKYSVIKKHVLNFIMLLLHHNRRKSFASLQSN